MFTCEGPPGGPSHVRYIDIRNERTGHVRQNRKKRQITHYNGTNA